MDDALAFWLRLRPAAACCACCWLASPRDGGDWAGRGRDAAAECGGCGYDVRALPGDVCPEGGGDLDVVGRLTRWQRRRRTFALPLRLATWTLGVAFVGGLCSLMALNKFVPTVSKQTAEYPASAATGERYVLVERNEDTGTPLRRGFFDPLHGQFAPPQSLLGPDDCVVSLSGFNRDAAAVATLRWDRHTGDWAVRAADAGILTSGRGAPTPRAVWLVTSRAAGVAPQDAARAEAAASPTIGELTRFAPFVRPWARVGIPGEAGTASFREYVAEAHAAQLYRDLLLRYFPPPNLYDVPVEDQRGVLDAALRARVPTVWLNRLPGILFGGTFPGICQNRALAPPGWLDYGPPATASSTRPVWSKFLPVVAVWPLVWLLGLPLVLRRRAVRANLTTPEAATGSCDLTGRSPGGGDAGTRLRPVRSQLPVAEA